MYVGEGGAQQSSLPQNPHAYCPQCCCLSPLAGGRYVGFVAEAVRRFPGSPRPQYMHAQHPLPSLLRECLLGRLGVRRGVVHSPVKLSFSLCEQVGELCLGSGPPCCLPSAACSPSEAPSLAQQPETFPLSLSLLPSPDFLAPSGPIGASIQLSDWCPWSPVCLSALPYPTPSSPQLAAATHRCGLAGLPPPTSPPTVPPKG